ncbi:MAG: FAD-binding oxidoreductase [Saprospiraceae bacterium]|nr:FAD-binding oxidoreductase [Saprospiraceae bacterium]
MESLSYWEKKHFFENVDIAIIGAGLVGLSTGISLLEKNPELNILILDRGIFPLGASTRNAGFACFGSAGELLDDLKDRPAEDVFDLFAKRYQGIQKLIRRIPTSGMDYRPDGGFELVLNTDQTNITQALLENLNQGIEALTGLKNYFYFKNEQLKEFNLKGFEAIICNDWEACIDPVKTLESLNGLFRTLGGKILYGTGIARWTEHPDSVEILLQNDLRFESKLLCFCTNGFTKQLFPEIEVQAARNAVLIIKPDLDLKIRGCFHVDRGFIYFREIDKHLLIGGGRHWDLNNEFTTEFLINKQIEKKLLEFAETHILNGTDYRYVQHWTGIMGLGPEKKPIINMITRHTGIAVRMGGMGVALASLAGEEASHMLLNQLNQIKALT